LRKSRPDEASAAFLDTTFLLPFFQLDILVESFTLEKFRDFLNRISEIHFSELSVFEAKAKIFRLSKKNPAYVNALENFGENLGVLRQDEKFIFHPYTKMDDEYFNRISSKNPDLDCFDAIILAQAADAELLITEDREILNFRMQKEFTDDRALNILKIKRWKDIY